jgi:hypothetical protein
LSDSDCYTSGLSLSGTEECAERCMGILSSSFDSYLGVPMCDVTQSACSTGTLVIGIGSAGEEPNYPNTLDGCADGEDGTYESDESMDRVIIQSSSNFLTEERNATITARVFVYSYTSDFADFYYASDAYNPQWQYIGTVSPSGDDFQDVSINYTVPRGANTQAVRVNFRYLEDVGTCTQSGYDDRDDIAFSVLRLAKFVRISLSGDSTLQLAEVQAFDDNGINRALSSGADLPVATQSSTYLWSRVTPCPATIANDGVTQSETSSTCDGVSHTNTESNPWWMVEFDDLYAIEEVILWNRMTCCSGDLSNAKVELLDENSNLISQIADIGNTTGLQNISLGIASFVAPTATKSPTSSPTLGPYATVDSGMCADANSYMFDGLYYNCAYPATVDLSTCISKCDQLSSLNYWGNHNGISLEQNVEMESERCICHYDSNQTIPVYDPTCWAKLTSFTSPNIGSGEVASTYASSSTACYKRRCYPFCESSQPSTSSQPSSQPSLEVSFCSFLLYEQFLFR